MIHKEKLRYLIVGAANTVFGYCSGIVLYEILSPVIHIIFIATLINIVNISVSFLTYKLFVFRSKGIWWQEYLRSYLVYGTAALISIVLIWFLVDGLKIPFWIAQAVLIIFTVVVSYFGHSKFTFASKVSK